MKTPHAILIGLSLIAAAIFFKDTITNFDFVKDAHANTKVGWYKCNFNLMDAVHTDGSAANVAAYCDIVSPITK